MGGLVRLRLPAYLSALDAFGCGAGERGGGGGGEEEQVCVCLSVSVCVCGVVGWHNLMSCCGCISPHSDIANVYIYIFCFSLSIMLQRSSVGRRGTFCTVCVSSGGCGRARVSV